MTGSASAQFVATLRNQPIELVRYLCRSVSLIAAFTARGPGPGVFWRLRLLARLAYVHLRVPGGVTLPEILFLIESICAAPTSGVLVEIGSWKGLSATCLSLVSDSRAQQLVAVDTFAGLPQTEGPVHVASNPDRSYVFEQGAFAGSLDEFWFNVRRFGRPARVSTVCGDVCTMTSLGLPKGALIAYAFIDVDLPTSYLGALRLVAPHIAEGTRIHLHEGLLEPVLRLVRDQQFWENLGLAPPSVEILQETRRLRTLLVELKFSGHKGGSVQRDFATRADNAASTSLIRETEKNIRAYIRANPDRFRPSNARSAGCLALLFALIATAIASFAARPAAAIPAFLVIGVCQYHLSVAIHEASHFNLFRPRWLNEASGHILAWLEGFDFPQFRTQHMLHHAHYGTTNDPDWEEYQLRGARSWRALLVRILIERCVVGAAWKIFKRNVFPSKQVSAASRGGGVDSRWISFPMIGATQALIFLAFAWLTEWWLYFVFWLLPLSIFPTFIAGIRMFGEHGQPRDEQPSSVPTILQARTGVWNFRRGWSWLGALERITLGAFNFNYHHEHHWFPSLPYHALPKVHAMLWQHGHYDVFSRCYAETYIADAGAVLFANAETAHRAAEPSA